MCEERLNGSVVLNIHKEFHVNIEEVINVSFQSHLEGLRQKNDQIDLLFL